MKTINRDPWPVAGDTKSAAVETDSRPGSGVPRHRFAFTLVELLTVMAVMAVIAALIFPVYTSVKRQAFIHNAQAQMAQLETAIESYKSAYGFYPPSCAYGPLTNQLYYELAGTMLTNPGPGDSYTTLDHLSTMVVGKVGQLFGTNVGGFMNCSKPGGDESARQARNFLPGLNTNQVSAITVRGKPPAFLLVYPHGGPDPSYNPLGTPLSSPVAPADHVGVNPWRYVPDGTNNPGSYDLWIQLDIAGTTNLICNWTKQVQINNPLVP